MNLLLDTCVFLWLTDHTEELSGPAREALEDGGNALYFSQVSALEIQIKFSKGKLLLTQPPERFITEALKKHGIECVGPKNETIWTSGKLPFLHQDPFDRLLIAQAIQEGWILVTPDRNIQRYAVRTLW